MNVRLSPKSAQKLASVKPELQRVINHAFESMPFDITVLEGIRSLERQKQLVAQGASQTLKSRHLIGEAVDLAPYPIDWNDLSRFRKMAEVIKNSSDILNIPIEWGGDWKTLVDMPHFQLKH